VIKLVLASDKENTLLTFVAMKVCASGGYWNPVVDHPELLRAADDEDEDGDGAGAGNVTVDELLRNELFLYAKRNMALVNVYIKVSSRKFIIS